MSMKPDGVLVEFDPEPDRAAGKIRLRVVEIIDEHGAEVDLSASWSVEFPTREHALKAVANALSVPPSEITEL
jgi:hypothetical protein